MGKTNGHNGSAYTIVMTPKGELTQVYIHNETFAFEMVRPHPDKTKYLYMSSNIRQSEAGPLYEWDWGDGGDRRAVDPSHVASGGRNGEVIINSHDVRWSQNYEDAAWVNNQTGVGYKQYHEFLTLVNTTTGDALARLDEPALAHSLTHSVTRSLAH